MTLAEMKPGQSGRIACVVGKGTIRRRLMDMGIICGVELKVLKVAPLNDPLEIKIKDYNIALRLEEARNILMEDVK